MLNSANSQSGFGSVVLVLMIVILTAAIGYSVSQVNKPTLKLSFADENTETTDAPAPEVPTPNTPTDPNPAPANVNPEQPISNTGYAYNDSVNWGSVFNIAIEGMKSVVGERIQKNNDIINDPKSSQTEKDRAITEQNSIKPSYDKIDATFGKVTYDKNGKPNYTERNEKIKEEWNNALERNKVAKLPDGFVPDVTNPPIVPRGTSDLERYNSNSQKAANAASQAIKP